MEVVDKAQRAGDGYAYKDAPGVIHRLNLQLPYKEYLPAENERLVADVMNTLTSFDSKRDPTSKVLRGCSGLSRIRDLKYSMDDDTRLVLAQTLFDLAFPSSGPSLPWRIGNKVMSSLEVLIGKKVGQLGLVGRLVLPWRPVLDALEEAALRGFPLGSNSSERSRLLTLLPLIGEARRYWASGADREIWEEVKDEIYQLQTQDAFKALFVLCHFLPSRTPLYDELLPEWFSLWGKVDHCPAWDGTWLTIFCRARKHASPSFDWTPYMADIFTHARSSVRTPLSLGDAGSAPLPGSRQVAYQYQAFAPSAARSAAAKAGKISKLLVFLLGKGGPARLVRPQDVAIVPTAGGASGTEEYQAGHVDGGKSDRPRMVSPGALDLLSLFRSLRTYFHPSNGGRWSIEMALLTTCVCRSLAHRVGVEQALREAEVSLSGGELTRDDAGMVVEALLPLVLEMVYSKNSSVGSTSNACLSCLATLSPKTVAPAIAELILRALDPIASINHTHQAPAALRALAAVFRPLMYPRPYLAPYLPSLLELSLPGLDPNDVLKTTVTLQLYHLILCWVPVQGNPVRYESGDLDGWTPPPQAWLDATNSSAEDDEVEVEALYTACENLSPVIMEWSIALLDRLFEVLRHKDKASKGKAGDLAVDTMNVAASMTGLSGGAGGGTGTVGGRGGGGGGGMTGLSSIITSILGGGGGEAILVSLMRLVTQQLFTMADEAAGDLIAAKIVRFVTDSPLPNVEKDAAAMVEMMAWARPERTVATLYPVLCEGLVATSKGVEADSCLLPGASPVLLRWRLRLLSGLARGAGAALAPKGSSVRRLIAAGIKHNDKSVRKSARKLLRKILHGLCELWGAETRSLPPSRWANCNSVLEWRRLCEPLPPGEHDIEWTKPSVEGLKLAAELLKDFVVEPMRVLSMQLHKELAKVDGDSTKSATAPSTGFWREELKTIDYAIRGAICLLGDRATPEEDGTGPANELRDDMYLAVGNQAPSCLTSAIAGKEGPELFVMVAGLRARMAEFLRVALEACREGKGPADVKAAKLAIGLSRRIACSRGAREHLARRQAMTLLAYKVQLRDIVSSSAAKKEVDLALEAAASGDTNAAEKARQILAIRGTGGEIAFPRKWLIGRVILQHMLRLNMVPRTLAFAARDSTRAHDDHDPRPAGADAIPWPAASAVLDRYRALFSALVSLSSGEYAMVRAAAQSGVGRLGSVYPWFARETVPKLIDRLSLSDGDYESQRVNDNNQEAAGEAAHRRLTGACYLLYQTRSMRHVVSTWSLLRKLLLALCNSQAVLARLPSDKQEKAAARVTILFTSYASSWRANPVENDKDLSEYEALREGVLERLAGFNSAAPSVGGGWRYQLMASWCLLHLVRPAGASKRSGLGTRTVALMGPPPITMWRWFADCLAEGEGQPLQRLSLGALARLLSTSGVEGGKDGAEISALLSSTKFLRSLVRAIGHNHRKQATEAGAVGSEQWSLGVKEIMQDAGRGDTREMFPKLRFATRSRLFWARNARVVSSVFSAIAPDSRDAWIRGIVEEVAAARASAAHEDKRSFDCATAEISAGIMAALAREGGEAGGRKKVLYDTVLPFVESELERVSLDGRLDWTDAIRFVLDRGGPIGMDLLAPKIVERTTALLQGGGKGRDDYSVLLKWLSFIGAVLIELSASEASASTAESIARELFPLLVGGLDHPFKACREEIARDLFLVTNVMGAEWGVPTAEGIRDSILAESIAVEDKAVSQGSEHESEVADRIASLSMLDSMDGPAMESTLLASAMAMSDGALNEDQEASVSRASKRLSLRRETVLQWLHQTASAGDHARHLPILVTLLPVALQSVRDSNIEVATMSRGACLSCAAALTAHAPKKGLDTSALGGLVDVVLSAASSDSSWRVRRGAVAVACVLQTRLHFILSPAQHRAIDSALVSLLGDTRPEVHATARLALSTRVAHLTPKEARVLYEGFAAEADSAAARRKKRRKVAKREAATAAAAFNGDGSVAAVKAVVGNGDAAGDLSVIKAQQIGVLGLSAVVLAAPCDVPSWVPGALESLARHVDDESPGRLPVRQTVTYTFKEFRRTHQDKWQESHRGRFTRDQLDTFDDVLGGAHSYFI